MIIDYNKLKFTRDTDTGKNYVSVGNEYIDWRNGVSFLNDERVMFSNVPCNVPDYIKNNAANDYDIKIADYKNELKKLYDSVDELKDERDGKIKKIRDDYKKKIKTAESDIERIKTVLTNYIMENNPTIKSMIDDMLK